MGKHIDNGCEEIAMQLFRRAQMGRRRFGFSIGNITARSSRTGSDCADGVWRKPFVSGDHGRR